MVPGSYQTGDDYKNCLYYSDLDYIFCYHGYIIGSDFSERVLIVDYLSAVDTGMTVADIKVQRRTDTDNMT